MSFSLDNARDYLSNQVFLQFIIFCQILEGSRQQWLQATVSVVVGTRQEIPGNDKL